MVLNKDVSFPCCRHVPFFTLTAVVSSAVTATALWLLKGWKFVLLCEKKSDVTTEERLASELCLNKEKDKSGLSAKLYESECVARQYMEFHYTPSFISFNQRLVDIRESFSYPIRVAQKFKEFFPNAGNDNSKALDIGCATGASVLEMSKYFSSVIGVDYSETFIHLAHELVNNEKEGHVECVTYTAPDQGDIVVNRSGRVPPGTFPERCMFFRGDAMRLLEEDEENNTDVVELASEGLINRYDDVSWYQVPPGEKFDGVLAANLLCRVSDPRKLLDTFPRLLREGGILVLASPYSWWEGATPKSNWIGGVPGGPRSEELVKEILLKSFDLLSETDEAFLIRDHVRRYQLGFAHCTVWRRR